MSSNSNVHSIKLDEITALQSDLDEVCTAIVHSILFARVLGPVVPSEGHVQSLDVYYPMISVNDKALLNSVATEIASFCAQVVKPESERRGVLRIKFFEKVTKGTWWKVTENVLWEQWYIPIRLASDPSNNRALEYRTKTAHQLNVCLNQIIETVNDPRFYFPKLATEVVPFPYVIEQVNANDSSLINVWSIITSTAKK